MENGAVKKDLLKSLLGERRIAARFRNYNIALFALACLLIIAAMSASFYNVISKVSADYAERYARSSANALSAHVSKEIALMAKAARSGAVVDWMTDEMNEEKKILAYKELAGILGELYSSNLYVGFTASRNEYQIEKNRPADKMLPFDKLDMSDEEDVWYFQCVESPQNYTLSVGLDHLLQKKRVWLDYKVVQNGVTVGVICTGLEFSQVARELLAHYNNVSRGMVIDSMGLVNIDSDKLNREEILHYEIDRTVEDEFSDPALLAAIKSHIENIRGYFRESSPLSLVKLSPGPYRYATIAPIAFTDWSAVILYDASASFNMAMFIPAFAVTLVLLIAFALAISAVGNRLIFYPLAQLVGSLAWLQDNKKGAIYGLGRQDEFGTLSKTINDLFSKAIRDALTNLYNRRYMENTLKEQMDFLSRSNGLLSVLMLDIDYFKKYNDKYGHEEGDVCLKNVAQALAGSVTRVNDFVARYGGEEFIAVLPNTGESGACVIAQKMLDSVRLLGLPHEDNAAAPVVSVSIGVTTGAVQHTDNWEDYVKRADEALYMSKQNGRNRYTYAPFSDEGGIENSDVL